MTKTTLIKWAGNALIVALVACIPLGPILAYWFENPSWLILCATVFIFLS